MSAVRGLAKATMGGNGGVGTGVVGGWMLTHSFFPSMGVEESHLHFFNQ